jgi:hypothetical protein
MAAKQKTPPWKTLGPPGRRKKTLSDSEKKRAQAAAKKAGRRYPNRVDNMRVAAKKSR